MRIQFVFLLVAWLAALTVAAPASAQKRSYNTAGGAASVGGATGGIFLVDPSSGAQGSVRLQLAIDTFAGSDFLQTGDELEQSGQTLSVSWTALDLLEVYGSLLARGTSSTQPSSETLQLLGDTAFGFKLFGRIGGVWHVGGDASLSLLNGIGGSVTLLDATRIGLRGDLGVDLRDLEDPLPFIGRFELGYMFDNGAKVVDRVEDARYADLIDKRPRLDENQHLVTRFERFGLGVNRVDLFRVGVGVEVPLELTDATYLHPLAEWRLGIPVNRQGYDCAVFPTDAEAGTRDGADDTCLSEAGFAAWPMNLAVGARFVPPVRGVSLTVAVDFGLNGADRFVRELAPNAPYTFLVTLGYDFDARPVAPVVPVAPAVVAPPPVAPTGRIRGLVVAEGTGVPVPGAAIRFVGHDDDTQLVNAAGRFVSPAFGPGEVAIEVTQGEHVPALCSATITEAGGDVDARCVLSPLPAYGRIEGRVVDLLGTPVAGARVAFVGSSADELRTDAAGDFVRGELAPGEYTLRVESDAHLLRIVRVTVVAQGTAHAIATLVPRSEAPGVKVRGTQIRVPGLAFHGESSAFDGAASLALAELADLLLRDDGIRFVRIHGDGGQSRALSRAIAIQQRLVEAGVAAARLEAASEPARKLTLTIVK